MEIQPRSAWGAVPPDRRTLVKPSDLEGVTVHWFGSPKAAASHAGCDDLLRGVQKGHMAPGGLGVPDGGSDIGYNHAVCPHGTVYELRGFGVKTGANGTAEGNAKHCAIVYMAGVGDPFTEAGKVGLNFLISEWRKRGAGTAVSPHARWTGSSCPGPDILAWLKAGRPVDGETEPEEPEMKPWMPLWLNWYLNERKPGDERPKTINGIAIPEPPYPDLLWDMVKAAELYRESKPDSSADLAALKAKIEKAKKALA
jgi:hypothetical protein